MTKYRGYRIEVHKFTRSSKYYGHVREIGKDTADCSTRLQAFKEAKKIVDNQPEYQRPDAHLESQYEDRNSIQDND